MTPYVQAAATDMAFERRLQKLAEAKQRSDAWRKEHPGQQCSLYTFLTSEQDDIQEEVNA